MAIFQSLESNPQPSQNNTPKAPSKTRKVLRYTMMPEILPRIRGLGIHFGHFAYLLALVFASARLIPQSHPVMNAANIGRFGVRQVIAIAANNITWDRKHIDQIGIFSAIIIGIIMIIIQAGLIAASTLIGGGEASAQAVTPSSFFAPGNGYTEVNDPMMIFFAQVFGDLGGFWGFDAASATDADGKLVAPGVNSGIQTGIHQMLSLYSMAMMVIAVIIVLYYILTVIGEAAKTGTPFGQRFNSLWAPIRLVIALGLLVPLGSGLNSAQYLTLSIAKMGSGLGTVAWHTFLDSFVSPDPAQFAVAKFETPWIRDTAARVFLMEVCRQGYNKYNSGYNMQRDSIADVSDPAAGIHGFEIYYTDSILGFDAKCGKIHMRLTASDSGLANASGPALSQIATATENAVVMMTDPNGVIALEAKKWVDAEVDVGGTVPMTGETIEDLFNNVMTEAVNIENLILVDLATDFETMRATTINELVGKLSASWVYSGAYYLELGRMIQATKDLAVGTVPNTAAGGVYSQGVFSTNEIDTTDPDTMDTQMNRVNHMRWVERVGGSAYRATETATRYYFQNINLFIDDTDVPEECTDINMDSGIMTAAACSILAMIVPDNLVLLADPNHKELDPMSTMINAGYEITQRAWKYVLGGLALSGGGSLFSSFGGFAGPIGALLSMAGSILVFLGTIGLAAGIILYFLLPLFPFIYFFFAIVSWVMEIMEAIIAMPLWALAHLRIDGDGMPGQAAVNGYYLLLAILLRPALIVIGLIAGAVIFSAAVFLLQTLFHEVLLVKGAGSVTGLEVLIYTLFFTFIAYTAGVTSFKLVDSIPNQILRWIGSGANTFSDGKDDPIGNSNQMAFAAAGIMGSGAASTLSQGASGLGQGMGQAGKGVADEKGWTKAGKQQQAADAEGLRRHNETVDAVRDTE